MNNNDFLKELLDKEKLNKENSEEQEKEKKPTEQKVKSEINFKGLALKTISHVFAWINLEALILGAGLGVLNYFFTISPLFLLPFILTCWVLIRINSDRKFKWLISSAFYSLLFYMGWGAVTFILNINLISDDFKNYTYMLSYLYESLVVIGNIIACYFFYLLRNRNLGSIKYKRVLDFLQPQKPLSMVVVALALGVLLGVLLGKLIPGLIAIPILISFGAILLSPIVKTFKYWVLGFMVYSIVVTAAVYLAHFNAIGFIRYSWYDFIMAHRTVFYQLGLQFFVLSYLKIFAFNEEQDVGVGEIPEDSKIAAH
ncbi:hypothetical protein [Desulfofalx alkaliphila]|uniref:hypothetical protein n=1 Tax=Desulfofalx alkaliphila TaxID=105483 RepID=UPI0004E223BD|nr:hypothetical protein [Desulfofalx alkaliphila]